MRTVYITIGNSDNKLTQEEWSDFCASLMTAVVTIAEAVHGEWYSPSSARWQNMCVCACIDDCDLEHDLRNILRNLCLQFDQDSIALADVDNIELVEP